MSAAMGAKIQGVFLFREGLRRTVGSYLLLDLFNRLSFLLLIIPRRFDGYPAFFAEFVERDATQ